MTWIKICGITNLEDALTAVDDGADALGFVFYEKSPRKADAEVVRAITARLPGRIERVGVFVDESVEGILNTVARVGLTAVQLHGSASGKPEFIQRLTASAHLRIFRVLRADEVDSAFSSKESARNGINAFFLDSGTPEMPGGTGRVFDWKAAASRVEAIGKYAKVVVAGGLNSTNAAEAIRILRPWGVDVSSGVEAKPGKKDPEKIRAFISAVRRTDESA
jgi:phosphoribosylanthranilate isomerase